MAIRKINGASLKEIAWIFMRHYFCLLLLTAVVAFPVLYSGVNRWLENYAVHLKIGVWPFIGLLLVMAMVVLLTILSQLIRVVKVNPGETLKEG